jgi:hypothetical protein
MSKDYTFEEMQALMTKLASIPIEERTFYIEYLSKKMAAVSGEKCEKYKVRLLEIFDEIDEAENKFSNS